VNTILHNGNEKEFEHDGTIANPTYVSYSNVQGGFEGAGNINADPVFVNPANDDFHLGPGSPSVDSGTSEDAPDTDIDSNPRPRGLGVDMGAYEGPATDINKDGKTNAIDLQLTVNTALGLLTGYPTDLNGDNTTNAINIQWVVNAVLVM